MVTEIDVRSITIRNQFITGAENCKESDDSGSGRFGRCVRKDPTKPIILHFPGGELDCISYESTRDGLIITLCTGEEVPLRNALLQARQFMAAEALLEAAPHPGLPFRKRHCHLLSQVKVGDEVELALYGPFGNEECVGVAIERRPGGSVPHSTHSLEFFRERIDQCNAFQQHEEHGTPIPDRFRRDLAPWDTHGAR